MAEEEKRSGIKLDDVVEVGGAEEEDWGAAKKSGDS